MTNYVYYNIIVMTIKINKTKKQEVVKMKNYKKYEGIYDVDVEKFQTDNYYHCDGRIYVI